MPGFLLHVSATVQCIHVGPATLTSGNTRVLVNGTPALTMADVATVTGCPFTLPNGKPQPCVTIRWLPAAASRVFINGQPAVLRVSGPGPGICQSAEQIPQGTPIVSAIQTRVSGM
jgi:uncharacterized Zn-binding protein involved in type VI secretion